MIDAGFTEAQDISREQELRPRNAALRAKLAKKEHRHRRAVRGAHRPKIARGPEPPLGAPTIFGMSSSISWALVHQRTELPLSRLIGWLAFPSRSMTGGCATAKSTSTTR